MRSLNKGVLTQTFGIIVGAGEHGDRHIVVATVILNKNKF